MFATRLKHLFGLGLLACGVIGLGAAFAQNLQPDLPPLDPDPLNPPAVNTDPNVTLPLLAQPAKPAEPKKVAAKGIEDDDVPYGMFPSQAVVRVEDGKLIVRQRGHVVEAVQSNTTGNAASPSRPVTVYVRKSGVFAATHDPADVAVFDMKGNRLAAKDWKAQLKSDVHALIATDGKLPNPRELTLFKADTLLIVLPAAPAALPAGSPNELTWPNKPFTFPAPAAAPELPPSSTLPAPRAAPPARPAVPAPGATAPIAPTVQP